VLVVSTDPAHSLGDVLRHTLTAAPAKIAVRRGSLHACELDADAALSRWLASRRPALAVIFERGTWLERRQVESFLDLAVPGVDELVGLLEVQRLGSARAYDQVVVDTAPTGHTLRLLATPSTFITMARALDLMQEKHRVLAAALAHGPRADASEVLIEEIRTDGERLASLLRDSARTQLRWVMLPEMLSIDESERAVETLRADGICVSDILVNRLTLPPPSACTFCERRQAAESDAIRRLPKALVGSSAKIWVVPAQDTPARGLAALRALTGTILPLSAWKIPHARPPATSRAPAAPPTHRRVAAAVLGASSTRLLIVGGKGGVGKTTFAAALALAAARERRQRRVLLVSTDPAHSLGDVFHEPVGNAEAAIREGPPNLLAREIDAQAGWHSRVERYRASVARLFDSYAAGGHVRMDVDRAIVEELFSLAPPGMDEIAGMLAIIDALFPAPGQSRRDLVIVDTAPTGHALRLLAVPGQALAWVRQFMRALLEFERVPGFGELATELLALSRGLDRLRRLLAAPRSSGFVVVTRPETLPVLETWRLVEWLNGHGIARRALVVNGLTPQAGCRRCQRAAVRERRETDRLTDKVRRPGVIVEANAIAPPPRGVRQLEAWTGTWHVSRKRATRSPRRSSASGG
jgi:arsenite-transporting ATPase